VKEAIIYRKLVLSPHILLGLAGATALHMLILYSFLQSTPVLDRIEAFQQPAQIHVNFSIQTPEIETAAPHGKPAKSVKPINKDKTVFQNHGSQVSRNENNIEKKVLVNEVKAAAESKIVSREETIDRQEKSLPAPVPLVRNASLVGTRIPPEYPPRALRMGQEGTVWVHILINEIGSQEAAKIHTPSRYAALDEAALNAVKKWSFLPNIVNGRPVKTWVEVPIEFEIR
jgi:protein TonB